MIGYSVPVTVYDDDGDSTQWSALLTLDLEAGEPGLDLRLAGHPDNVIVTCSVEDAYKAIYEIQHQFNEWERARRREGAAG